MRTVASGKRQRSWAIPWKPQERSSFPTKVIWVIWGHFPRKSHEQWGIDLLGRWFMNFGKPFKQIQVFGGSITWTTGKKLCEHHNNYCRFKWYSWDGLWEPSSQNRSHRMFGPIMRISKSATFFLPCDSHKHPSCWANQHFFKANLEYGIENSIYAYA